VHNCPLCKDYLTSAWSLLTMHIGGYGARCWYWPGRCQALVALLVSGARIGPHSFFEMHQLTRMESASLAPQQRLVAYAQVRRADVLMP
jgi:hypothetical protein